MLDLKTVKNKEIVDAVLHLVNKYLCIIYILCLSFRVVLLQIHHPINVKMGEPIRPIFRVQKFLNNVKF